MDNETREALSKYRFEKAEKTLETAIILYKDIKDNIGANNRAYYAIFYAIRAILILDDVDFKRHKDVIGYFNQNYIKTEVFSRKLGRKISAAQKVREDNDYDDNFQATDQKVEQQLQIAKEVIKEVEQYLIDKKIIL